MKRIIDILASSLGLTVTSPLLIATMLLIWRQDYSSPFYIAERVGKDEKKFNMVKLRSMIKNADKSGVDSTSSTDNRITSIGHFVRKYKLDELTQLINVFLGDMSLVGPRPNVKTETDLYTKVEKKLLTVKPGITDFSSIVFSDEGEILKDSKDPDIDYNQLIRPWKSRLGLLYVEKNNLFIDFILIYLTLITIFSREKALIGITRVLAWLRCPENIIKVAKRKEPLAPYPPPGSKKIVNSRNKNN